MSGSKEYERLMHDITSKCASIKSAATLLPGATPARASHFLSLMEKQAEALAASIRAARGVESK